jgi:hypothetical protein
MQWSARLQEGAREAKEAVCFDSFVAWSSLISCKADAASIPVCIVIAIALKNGNKIALLIPFVVNLIRQAHDRLL